MPIAEELLARIEDVRNRLAAESVIAMPGGDDGLVPAYSLLGELEELCATVPPWREKIAAVRRLIDGRLEAAQPFDEETVAALRATVEFLQVAPPSPGSEAGGAGSPEAPESSPAAASAAAAPGDEILKIDIGDNRELLTEFYREGVEHLEQVEASLLALEQRPDDAEALNAIFRSFHTIKGNAGFLGLTPMHTLAHEVETLLDLARKGRLRLVPATITEILRSRDALQALIRQVAAALETGRMPDRVIPVGHLIAAVRRRAAGAPDPAGSPGAPPAQGEGAGEAGRDSPGPRAAASQTVRVSTEKLDALMDMVGELVIVQGQLSETARCFGHLAPPLAGNVGQLNRIMKELQHTAMSVRMIPIKPTFQKMERLARDLARECGRRRFSRRAAGRPSSTAPWSRTSPTRWSTWCATASTTGSSRRRSALARANRRPARVSLRAYHQGSQIVIELRTTAAAWTRRRSSPRPAGRAWCRPDAQPTPDEIRGFIFLPGILHRGKSDRRFRPRRGHGRRPAQHREAPRPHRDRLRGGRAARPSRSSCR